MIKKEGPGWRLIRDPSRGNFSTLLGGQNWAIELTDSEWDSFVQIVLALHQQYLEIQDQLMGDEDITLEMESQPWLAILKGDRLGLSLKFILCQTEPFHRGVEIFWPSSVTKFLINAVEEIGESFYL